MLLVLSQCYAWQWQVKSINLITPNMLWTYDSLDPNKTHALNALIMKFVNAKRRSSPEVEIWGRRTADPGMALCPRLPPRSFDSWWRTEWTSPKPVNIAQQKGHSIRELADLIQRQVSI